MSYGAPYSQHSRLNQEPTAVVPPQVIKRGREREKGGGREREVNLVTSNGTYYERYQTYRSISRKVRGKSSNFAHVKQSDNFNGIAFLPMTRCR